MQHLGAINIFKPRLYGKKVVAEKEVTLSAKTALASVFSYKRWPFFLSQQLLYILRLSKIALTHVQMVSPWPSWLGKRKFARLEWYRVTVLAIKHFDTSSRVSSIKVRQSQNARELWSGLRGQLFFSEMITKVDLAGRVTLLPGTTNGLSAEFSELCNCFHYFVKYRVLWFFWQWKTDLFPQLRRWSGTENISEVINIRYMQVGYF